MNDIARIREERIKTTAGIVVAIAFLSALLAKMFMKKKADKKIKNKKEDGE